MRNTLAIMQRELLALFWSPIAYIVIAGFLVVTGVLALDRIGPGKPATLRDIFQYAPYLLSIFVPAITMRTLAEEYRSGTIESLMTAPVSDTQLVLGKYGAALAFFVIMIAGTLIYPVIMMMYGNPDLGATLASYIGMFLAGAAFTAIGLFASSLTRNQIVAWILTTVPLVLFVWLAFFIVQQVGGTTRQVLQQINISGRLDEFNRGLVTLDGVVFFLGVTALFLFLATKVVETQRWR